MSQGYRILKDYQKIIIGGASPETILNRLQSNSTPSQPFVPKSFTNSIDSSLAIWDTLPLPQASREILFDAEAQDNIDQYDPHIENYIGTLKIPVGLAGPLRVNGLHAQGDYYIPLATTEAALVASYSRVAQLISEVGGCNAALLFEGVGRAPVFVFNNLKEAGTFVQWVLGEVDKFREVAESCTKYGKLNDIRVSVAGSYVYLIFEYLTGDASGQNMVTLSTQAVMKYIEVHSPVKPQAVYLESSMSGDKKSCAQSFLLVRGKKVTAEVTIPRNILQMRLGVSPEQLTEYYRAAFVGSSLSGSMGTQGQIANALAAVYIACGQDAGCVSESSVGISNAVITSKGDFQVSVTLPNIMVGTVGGGTSLPSQKACLDIMGLSGTGNARAFAEVVAGLVLCGEISLSAALCSGQFSRAHEVLARLKKRRHT